MAQEVHYSVKRRPLPRRAPGQQASTTAAPPEPRPPHEARPRRPLRLSRSAAQLRPEGRDDAPPLPSKSPTRHRQRLAVDEVGCPFPLDHIAPFAPPPVLGRVRSSSAVVSEADVAAFVERVGRAGATRPSTPTAATIPTSVTSTAATIPSTVATPTTAASRWRTAVDEAQYFAGGLLGRPSESTRHHTIIRHSHALVWYRGPSTAVSISILADVPLPAARSVWLQAKGFSGDVGMTVKALVGSTSTWLDVTPARQVTPSQLADVDERGVQRDLQRFAERASGRTRAHVPRETHLVRIPAAATDGYFRLVVCAGEDCGSKVLCGSPVFRIASTSANLAVVRGASLATMPLEMSVKLASTIGQQAAKKYAGLAAVVVNNGAQRALKKTPMLKNAGRAAQYGYRNLGVAGAVDDGWNKGQRGQMLEQTVALIGPEAGPEPPFPFQFEGKVVRGSGWSTAELGVPTANLAQVPDAIKAQLRGVYSAWVRIAPSKASDWSEAVVTIGPPRDAPPSVAVDAAVCVYVARDFDGATFFDARLQVMLMGFMHRHEPAGTDDMAGEHARDVMTTLASLGREAWTPREAVARIQAGRDERRLPDRLNEAASRAREQVDRLPLHWAGVRSEAGALRDRVYGNGGLWVAR